MKDKDRTKDELINKLAKLRQRIAKLEALESERKQMEETLTQEHNLLQALIDNIPDSIYFKDNKNRFIKVSKAKAEEQNTHPESMIGKTDFDFFPQEQAKEAFADDNRVRESNRPLVDKVEKITHADGTEHWVSTTKIPRHNEKGEVIGTMGISRDITRRKRAEMALKSERKHLEALFKSVRQGIATADLNHKIIDVNRSFTEMFGYTLEEIKGKDIDQIIVPREKLSEAIRITQQYDEGKISTVETVRKRKDGSLIPVEITGASIIIDSKQVGVYGIYKDITERKQVQEELQGTLKKLRRALKATIQAMVLTVETRDAYTAGHQQRVTNLARAVAKEMKLSKGQIDGIRMAGTIHDIGKIGVPAEILNKPTRLADIEFNLIKIHPLVGYNILKQIEFLWPVAKIVLQHHERMNGSGYPHGLSGEDILLEARILGVADVVEAMASHRPALGIDKALEEVSKNKGVFYDPQVVDACLKLFREKGFKFKTK